MLELNTPEINVALKVASQAMRLAQHVQLEMVTPALTKDDRSPVTVADYASQALVATRLAEAFPNDPLVAEEDASRLRLPQSAALLEQVTGFVAGLVPQATPERVCAWIDRGTAAPNRRYWVLDPVDGTKGFLRGDQYVVALALVVDGQVQVGVLGCPNLSGGYRPDGEGSGSLVVAARGQGAWTISGESNLGAAGAQDYEPLQVSRRSDPAAARILRSFEAGHTNVDQIEDFALALGVQAEPVRMDSQAKSAVLAAGKGDLMLRLLSTAQPNYREKIWDQAAGALVVAEAGGLVTDLDGKPLDFAAGRTLDNNRGVLASNRLLHPAALQALRAIRA
jgi:HAL2 family 3'(2'),5'-bisphosphate nucleotidase